MTKNIEYNEKHSNWLRDSSKSPIYTIEEYEEKVENWENEYWSKNINKSYPFSDIKRKTYEMSVEESEVFEKIIQQGFEEQVWVEKGRRIWRKDEDVPNYVRDNIEEAIDQYDVVYDDIDGIPVIATLRIQEVFKEELTQPQGWSIKSVAKSLRDEFDGFDKQQAETVARTEIAAILNKAREIGYSEMPEEKQGKFHWVGPQDHRTTKICTDIKEEVKDRGGSVRIDELKRIVWSKAEKYRAENGTPQRVDEWIPHINCRHSVRRKAGTY